MSLAEFNEAAGAMGAKEAADWTRLAGLDELTALPDGRVSALVTYETGGTPSGAERYIFVPAGGDRWLIDDIRPA
jgi:hypothetical protein